MEKYTCHVCGYSELLEPPWGEDGQTDNQQICPCCGVQFGYEDRTDEAIRLYRENWFKNGARWLMASCMPDDWNLVKQLSRINVKLSDFKL